MPLDPIETARRIRDSYVSYLTTTFPIRDPVLARQLRESLNQPGLFVKDVLLEVTPPLKAGARLAELVDEGLLSREFKSLIPTLPARLYAYQEKAIRKALKRRNLVIASGTTSGKTECFLVPILEHLFREQARGRLRPGVRALMIYPMNALANDQMVRLRKVLRTCPQITFGRYTGETEETDRRAIEVYRTMFASDPLPTSSFRGPGCKRPHRTFSSPTTRC